MCVYVFLFIGCYWKTDLLGLIKYLTNLLKLMLMWFDYLYLQSIKTDLQLKDKNLVLDSTFGILWIYFLFTDIFISVNGEQAPSFTHFKTETAHHLHSLKANTFVIIYNIWRWTCRVLLFSLSFNYCTLYLVLLYKTNLQIDFYYLQ